MKRFNNEVRTVDAAGPSSAVGSLQQVAQLPAWLFPIAHVKRKCGKSLHVGGSSAAGCKQPLRQTEPKHSIVKWIGMIIQEFLARPRLSLLATLRYLRSETLDGR